MGQGRGGCIFVTVVKIINLILSHTHTVDVCACMCVYIHILSHIHT